MCVFVLKFFLNISIYVLSDVLCLVLIGLSLFRGSGSLVGYKKKFSLSTEVVLVPTDVSNRCNLSTEVLEVVLVLMFSLPAEVLTDVCLFGSNRFSLSAEVLDAGCVGSNRCSPSPQRF